MECLFSVPPLPRPAAPRAAGCTAPAALCRRRCAPPSTRVIENTCNPRSDVRAWLNLKVNFHTDARRRRLGDVENKHSNRDWSMT